MLTQSEKCSALARLHAETQAWIIPNPWDVGSAKDIEAQGFKALATSSAAFAQTLGRADGQVTLEEKLMHCEALAGAVDIPVSVDFEDGFGDMPEQVQANVTRLAQTGVAGCSIEDFSRQTKTVFEFDHAVERIHAAVEAVEKVDAEFQLIARAENLLRQHADLEDTIKRLQAYEAAGAHVLYAPGLSTLEDVQTIVTSTNRPINVLMPFFPGVSLDQFTQIGVNRLSLGSALHIQTRNFFIEQLRTLAAS